MNEIPLQYWEYKRDSAIYNTRIARQVIFVFFALQILNLILNFRSHPLLTLLNGVLLLVLVFFIRENINRDFENLMANEFAKEIDIESFNPQFKSLVEEIINVFGINATIYYYVVTTNFDYSPHVLSNQKRNFLVIPLGFFKLLHQRPEEAKAILAHELSHIAQRDTNLSIMVKVVLKYIFAIFLPLQLLLYFPLLYYFLLTSIRHGKEADHLSNAIFSSVNVDVNIFMAGAENEDNIARLSTIVFLIILFSIPILFWIYRFLKSVCNKSEYVADTGAVTLTSVEVVKEALERITHDKKYKKKKALWFKVNPSVKWRLKQLDTIERKYKQFMTNSQLSKFILEEQLQ